MPPGQYFSQRLLFGGLTTEISDGELWFAVIFLRKGDLTHWFYDIVCYLGGV